MGARSGIIKMRAQKTNKCEIYMNDEHMVSGSGEQEAELL